MPSKYDSAKIADPFLKRSAKLLPCQKEMMHYWHGNGLSIGKIAKLFGCSKRLVQFELFPERHKKNLELRHERGGSAAYYVKQIHTAAIKKHRQYKNRLFKAYKSPSL